MLKQFYKPQEGVKHMQDTKENTKKKVNFINVKFSSKERLHDNYKTIPLERQKATTKTEIESFKKIYT